MPAPAQCPDCAEVRALQNALSEAYAHDALASKLIDAAEAEVRDLKAWKAEAQQRGAEMARRGLEITAENARLRELLTIAVGHSDGRWKWVMDARAALKGDGGR